MWYRLLLLSSLAPEQWESDHEFLVFTWNQWYLFHGYHFTFNNVEFACFLSILEAGNSSLVLSILSSSH